MSAGERMKYPYTITGKMMGFPWKFYWTQGRGFRYCLIAVGVTLPLFWKMQQALNSPGNVRMWQDIRAKRLHDHFAPPSDH